MKMTLNEMLVQMDGFSPNSGVIVLGATNFKQSLDAALTRPGRFDKMVNVPLPDVQGRKEIIERYSKDTTFAPDVDISVLARGTPGFSGAELYNLINQAAVKASIEDLPAVTHAVLEWAKDKILMGAERKVRGNLIDIVGETRGKRSTKEDVVRDVGPRPVNMSSERSDEPRRRRAEEGDEQRKAQYSLRFVAPLLTPFALRTVTHTNTIQHKTTQHITRSPPSSRPRRLSAPPSTRRGTPSSASLTRQVRVRTPSFTDRHTSS